jgi:anti-sigma-K factor RskA
MSTDVHTLSGAYALDALSPEEAAEFRRHLEGCQACRDEVRELQRAAARMGGAEASAPPAHLKARILAAAERTPQQPPRPAPAPDETADGIPDELAARRTGSARRRWPALLAGAAAALVVVMGGIVGLQAMQEDEPTLAPAVSQVFGADDARTATVGTENGGKLTVGVSPSRNEMAVDTRDLPELDDEHVYQLWAVHGDEVISVGILQDLGDGASMGMPEEDTEVAVTVEPEGGSDQPTSDPIVQVDPRAV